MIVKSKDFRKTRKILYGLLPLPIMMIVLPLVMIFIKDMLWNLNFNTNFGELIKQNINWKFLLIVAIHEVIIYFVYIYLIFFKNKKEQSEDKEQLTKKLEKLEEKLNKINEEIKELVSQEADEQEMGQKNSDRIKIESEIEALKSKINNIPENKNEI